MRFERDDFDWAMGELLHLRSEGRKLGLLPTALDRTLFVECMSVIDAQPLDDRLRARAILNSQYLL